MMLLWRLLNPKHGWTAFTFFSHKVLRWLCPFFLIALLVANVALASHRPYAIFLVIQGAFYLTALLAAFLPSPLRSAQAIAFGDDVRGDECRVAARIRLVSQRS